VDGKPRPVPIAYLGKADDLLARLRGAEALRLRSRAHGAVAALWAVAQELDVVGTIDRHLAAAGRRLRRRPRTSLTRAGRRAQRRSQRRPVPRAGGRGARLPRHQQTAFAEWADTTTLGELVGVDVRRLTSQHFWDQMDQLPWSSSPTSSASSSSAPSHASRCRWIRCSTTPLTSSPSSPRPTLNHAAARGHQKQKRDDLRQVGVALLCSRRDGLPLWHQTYGGQVADATCFATVLPAIRERLVQLGRDLSTLTIVYDKGNVSRANQQLVDAAPFHHVSAYPPPASARWSRTPTRT